MLQLFKNEATNWSLQKSVICNNGIQEDNGF